VPQKDGRKGRQQKKKNPNTPGTRNFSSSGIEDVRLRAQHKMNVGKMFSCWPIILQNFARPSITMKFVTRKNELRISHEWISFVPQNLFIRDSFVTHDFVRPSITMNFVIFNHNEIRCTNEWVTNQSRMNIIRNSELIHSWLIRNWFMTRS